ncbi:MAG: NAD-dependent epimerase, partial [Myxococcota bacterium]
VHVDVNQKATLDEALQDCNSLIYLVHGMADGGNYEHREWQAAQNVVETAEKHQLERIVYLGGVLPEGPLSKHLQSRIHTGEVLRKGNVPVFELRSGMIVGQGSESWGIVRDLSMRLPLMVLPKWSLYHLSPVSIRDVCVAMRACLTLECHNAGCYNLPGAEEMSIKDMLLRVSKLRSIRPTTVNVPWLSPQLSSLWLRLITRANFKIARELLSGFTGDLIGTGPSFWTLLPQHTLQSFEAAARQALHKEEDKMPSWLKKSEALLQKLYRSA